MESPYLLYQPNQLNWCKDGFLKTKKGAPAVDLTTALRSARGHRIPPIEFDLLNFVF